MSTYATARNFFDGANRPTGYYLQEEIDARSFELLTCPERDLILEVYGDFSRVDSTVGGLCEEID